MALFGYIKVDQANLLGKEYEAYKGIYCSLCKQLGRDYSVFARFILSYDCTFYAMLALDLEEDPPCFRQGRCRFNPLKKCHYINDQSEALPLAAALSVISAYYKLRDNLLDSPWVRRIGYRLIQPLFAHWRKKAAKKYPAIDASVSQMLEDQIAAEKSRTCVPDMAAAPTAKMLGDMCALLAEHIPLRQPLDQEDTGRILQSMGYFLGRWIYLIDAADDYKKDQKHHNFNPFLLPGTNASAEYMEATLNHALSEALLCYGLLEPGRYDGIIKNVLYYSCVKIQKNIIDGYCQNESGK